eukprot:COSAG02_NODE_1770_length_10993_cov_48.074995_3_plen_137_part_00
MVPWRREPGAEQRLRELFRRVVRLDEVQPGARLTKQQLVERLRAVSRPDYDRGYPVRTLITARPCIQDDELLSAMHIPVDGEQVEVVEVSEENELVDAALTSLGGCASDEMDEVGPVASTLCESLVPSVAGQLRVM